MPSIFKKIKRRLFPFSVTGITKTKSFDCELSVEIVDDHHTELYLCAVQCPFTNAWQIRGEDMKTQPEEFKFRVTFYSAEDNAGCWIQLMSLRKLRATESEAYVYVTLPRKHDVCVMEHESEIPDQPSHDDPRLLVFCHHSKESHTLDSTFMAPLNNRGFLLQMNKDRNLVLQRFDDRPGIDISLPSRRDREALLTAVEKFCGFDFNVQEIKS